MPPLTLLPVLGDGAAIPAIAAGLILILIALLDAAVGSFRLRGIGVDLPTIVRMTRDRESSLELSLTHSDMQATSAPPGASPSSRNLEPSGRPSCRSSQRS